MLKLLFEGDSYGLPRFDRGTGDVALSYEETYPEQLRRILSRRTGGDIMTVNRCFHANTTNSLISGEANELCFLLPDVTIIQLGLTDLWPAEHRKVHPLQAELAGRNPWVDLEAWGKNLERFASCAAEMGSKVIFVGIPGISPGITFRYPVVTERIRSYNLRTEQLAEKNPSWRFLDWKKEMERYPVYQLIGEDGIHPTAKASRLLAELLADMVGAL